MLGVVAYDQDDPADDLLREYAREIGVEDTYAKTRVGVFLDGRRGETVPDPYFGGAGPDRTSCLRCGRCMIGCPHGAKNTLVKNYLWLAERAGAEVLPERMVVDVRPLGADDGSEGYEVITERPGAWLRRDRRRFTARGVVVAAGPLGTNRLLASCKLHGSLPALSDRIGDLVRTNSEAILAVTLPPRRAGHHAPGRDHRLDLSRPGDAHRDRGLRRRGRLDELALHGDGRRRHARDAAAEAAQGRRAPSAHVPRSCSTRAAGRGARSSCS